MSAQTIQEAFAPIMADYRAQVAADTWGHLAPHQNKTYQGHIVFAVGCYGDDELNPTILAANFKGLEDSPWLFDAMQEFIYQNRGSSGNVCRFNGTFRNYKFKGTIRSVYSSEAS